MRMKKSTLFSESLSRKRLAKPKLVNYRGRYGLSVISRSSLFKDPHVLFLPHETLAKQASVRHVVPDAVGKIVL